MTFVVHLINGSPAEVSINGKKASKKSWKFTPDKGILTIHTAWDVAKPLTIEIK